jgi:predicted transcriptional regulator
MLTLETIKKLLKDTNYAAVAQSVGVHPNTIYRLMDGQEPKYSTVKKLSDYFEDKGFING